MTLTKTDMITHLNATIGLNKSEAKEFVEAFFNEIKQVLSNGIPVKISGLGNFNIRDKKARPGRNGATGDGRRRGHRRR